MSLDRIHIKFFLHLDEPPQDVLGLLVKGEAKIGVCPNYLMKTTMVANLHSIALNSLL